MGKIPVPVPDKVWVAIRARMKNYVKVEPYSIGLYNRPNVGKFYSVSTHATDKTGYRTWVWFHLLEDGSNFDPYRH